MLLQIFIDYSPFLYYGTNYSRTSALLSTVYKVLIHYLPSLKFEQSPNFQFPLIFFFFLYSLSLFLVFDSILFLLYILRSGGWSHAQSENLQLFYLVSS